MSNNYECNRNKTHITIVYGSEPCPLCASYAIIKSLKAQRQEWADQSWKHRQEAVKLREALEDIKRNTRPMRPWKGEDIADEIYWRAHTTLLDIKRG